MPLLKIRPWFSAVGKNIAPVILCEKNPVQTQRQGKFICIAPFSQKEIQGASHNTLEHSERGTWEE